MVALSNFLMFGIEKGVAQNMYFVFGSMMVLTMWSLWQMVMERWSDWIWF